MLMKKIYLTLFGAMMMTGALAQSVEGYHLDSIYVETGGERTSKTVYEYNAAGQQAVSYDYSYTSQVEQLVGKTENSYNDNGVQTEDKYYDYDGANWVLSSHTVYSEFNSAGLPTVAITSELNDENPSAGLLPTTKQLFKAYYGNQPQDVELYAWTGADWMLSATMHFDFTSWGGIDKETMTISMFGMTMTQTSTYEYDDHHMPVKLTTESNMMGTMVYIYINTYDSNGLPTKVVTQGVGGDLSTYYFWSPNGSANINTLEHARQMVNGFYDLNGRFYNGTPDQRGLYIVNGRKVIVR